MDYLLEIAALEDAYGGQWGEHPGYPVSDWQYEVANDETRAGYWEWVWSKLELEKEGSR